MAVYILFFLFTLIVGFFSDIAIIFTAPSLIFFWGFAFAMDSGINGSKINKFLSGAVVGLIIIGLGFAIGALTGFYSH